MIGKSQSFCSLFAIHDFLLLVLSIRILTIIYILILVGIIVVADLSGTNFFAFLRYIPFGDKIGHFGLMGIFSLLVNLALRARTIRIWKLNYLLGSLFVFAIVLTEEVSQMFIGGRTFDWGDLLFDFAGIFVFGEIARIICRKQFKK